MKINLSEFSRFTLLLFPLIYLYIFLFFLAIFDFIIFISTSVYSSFSFYLPVSLFGNLLDNCTRFMKRKIYEKKEKVN